MTQGSDWCFAIKLEFGLYMDMYVFPAAYTSLSYRDANITAPSLQFWHLYNNFWAGVHKKKHINNLEKCVVSWSALCSSFMFAHCS